MADRGFEHGDGPGALSSVFARWRLDMKGQGWFRAGERVGVAASGGPDSMLLTAFLGDHSREVGFALVLVHFNHKLRGEASDGDEAFVRDQAEQLGLAFLSSAADVASAARQERKNLEATARELRYGFFRSLLAEGRLDKIATAHTASDQAETVLMRLVRGSGTRGLGGIRPVIQAAGGQIVRPFLSLTRAEVERELAQRGMSFRVDASNANLDRTRNWIRHQVLPLLEAGAGPGVARRLAGFASRAAEDEDYLQREARTHAASLFMHDGATTTIPCSTLAATPPAIARRVLRQALVDAAPCAAGQNISPSRVATSADLDALWKLARSGPSGARILLANGIEVRREFDLLVVEGKPPGAQSGADSEPATSSAGRGFSHRLQLPAAVDIPELGLQLRFRTASDAERSNVTPAIARIPLPAACDAETKRPQPAYNATSGIWLTATQMAAQLTLRNWRAGDRIYTAHGAKSISIKELFQRWRIPLRRRGSWPVLECGGEIVWTRGLANGEIVSARAGDRLLIVEERSQADGPDSRPAIE